MSRNKKSQDEGGLNSSSNMLLQSILDSQTTLIKNVAEIDKKLAVHIESSQKEFKAIRVLDETQNQILAEHASRSTQLEKDNSLRETAIRKEFGDRDTDFEKNLTSIDGRVLALEAPRKWWNQTKVKIVAWTTGVAALLEIIRYCLDLLHK